jgi:ferric-dicitrate binding protein FerR (iron transport regulator)
MKSDDLNIPDLLTDDSFINYCMKSSAKDVAFWESYLASNPGQRQLVEDAREHYIMLFNALAKADMDEQVRLISNKMSMPPADGKPVIHMNRGGEGRNARKIFPLLKISAAAVILVAATIAGFYHYGPGNTKPAKTFVSACGERKNIQLPDGSTVTLNAASKIEIDNSFGVSSRNVYLEGEAFFDVKHDPALPFVVHTPTMDIKALGTAFDVKAYLSDKVTETSLIRGLVEITLKESDNRKMLLHPNQKIRWVHQAASKANTSSTHAPQTTAADNLTRELKVTSSGSIKEIAWTENKLFFEDEPLEEVSRILGRWYGVNFHFEDDAIRNYRFTGMYEKEDLNTVLDFLKESRHFNYVIEPGDPITVNLSK